MFWFLSPQLIQHVYCMDSSIELRLTLEEKIASMEGQANYFREQIKILDYEFRRAILNNLPGDVRDEILLGRKEFQTNLDTETKLIRKLKDRLSSGDFDSSFTTSSSLGKRKN